MRVGNFGTGIVGLIIALGGAGCGSSESTDAKPAPSTTAAETNLPQTIELLSYWGNPGDAERVQALVDVHKTKHPNDQVINDARQSTDWDALLAERIAAGKTPDLYVQHSSEVAGFIQKHGADSLYPLDEFLATPSQSAVLPNLPSELLAECTANGKVYALPTGAVLRSNALFYNTRVLATNQLNAPTTIDELLAVCQKLKAANVNCVTVSFQTLLFEGLLAGVMGIDKYYAYRTGGAPEETLLRKGIDVYAEVIDNYLDPAALRPVDGTLDPEIAALMSGQAAMYFSGDWAKGIFGQLGWTAGVDFGVTADPGNGGLFVYAADVFTIPAGAAHVEGALSLLGTQSSMAGQIAFIGLDATPARSDVQITVDSVRQGIITDWVQAKRRLAANTTFAWEGPLQGFVHVTPHDKEGLLQVLLAVH